MLDSPRYEKFGRPVPYGKRFVFATGFLANAIVTTGVSKPRKVKQFVVEVDNVVFGPAGSATATALPNDLDSESLFAKKKCLYLTGEFVQLPRKPLCASAEGF